MTHPALNQEQQAAVLAREKNVLVLAGAGSGKTRTLIERVAWLMEQGASGHEIVCATFTRAAAGEMRARLEARVGREARKVTVSTFHGLGLGLLKKYGHHIGLRYGNLTVYTPPETDTLIRLCGEQLGLYARGKWKHGKKALDAMFAALERSGEKIGTAHPYYPVLQAFEAACRQNNAMPYYGLIHGLVELAEAGKVREFTNWKYLLVDEVQDLDPMQWRALKAITEHTDGAELYAVGDLSQSIYGFRGAVPAHLQHLMDAGALTVYELRNNYRSAPDIVSAANCLIRHNTSHRALAMRAMRDDAPHALAIIPNADSSRLADILAARHEWPHPPVVLCRNNRMLDRLSEELSARDVPHKRIGRRAAALHSPLFVKANAALKCIVNPFDETAFLLAHAGLGLDAGAYANIRVRAAEEGKSCFEAYRDDLNADILEAMPSASSTVKEALDWFGSGGYQFDPLDGYGPEYCQWLELYAAQYPTATITDYLDWLALVDVQDEMPARDEEPCILLMTCHAAKGLEFPCVIIAGCNEGVLPGRQALTAETKGDTAAIEDERRLMYVAVTRAKDRLILAVRPEKEGKEGAGERPSRFIAESGLSNQKQEHPHVP
ncbi:ATP-dependent helicase [Desulfovibrio sp. ZJ369]|uniref:ATP-dependent helicase n=1 Tax=Desulfovibrio sp. ZJ369 TaxID=2709793 RepID=UPI0013E9A99D|nr:ATP-dependent helicase [Desulfovibrio sp. ZJ369]